MDQKTLKELLHYDPETGTFTWKVSRSSRHRAGDIAGCTTQAGYKSIGILGKEYLAHRLAWLYVHGEFPKDKIDHRNGVKSDNWIDNIRVATKSQNGMNRGSQNGSFSKFKGVGWHKGARKWRAYIQSDGIPVHLGLFTDEVAAARAYNEAAIRLHGEFALLNAA